MQITTDLSAKYNELDIILADYAKSAHSRIVLLIGRGIAVKMHALAQDACVFQTSKDNPFTYCRRLMNNYSDAALMFASSQSLLMPEPVKSILMGVIAVLESRFNYFAEVTNSGSDPILTEMNELIKESVSRFSDAFLKITAQDETPPYIPGDIVFFAGGFDLNSAVDYTNVMLRRMTESLFPLIYADFKSEYEDCVKLLNDMEKRKQMSFFYELLKNEHNELSIIINKQISGIEAETALWPKDGSEYKTVFEILTAFRQAYQYTGNFIKDTDTLIEGARNKTPAAYPYDEFCDYIRSFAAADATISTVDCDKRAESFNPVLAELKTDFEAMFKTKTSAAFVATGFGHIVYRIKKYVSGNAAMADNLAGAFSKILKHYEQNHSQLETDRDFNIIKGIYETIAIKINCLEENKSILDDTAQELLDTGKSDIPELTDDFMSKLFEIWLTNTVDTPDTDYILNHETYVEFFNKRKKQHDLLLERVFKKTQEYMKDYLLFEVSTYEEIMNYSVSRLEASESPACLEFAKVCAQVAVTLTDILKRDNITPIRPQPHEMFNPREHEALMAEKNEDFQKGEIIKFMNCGYKQNDTVIIRANVIAAK